MRDKLNNHDHGSGGMVTKERNHRHFRGASDRDVPEELEEDRPTYNSVDIDHLLNS